MYSETKPNLYSTFANALANIGRRYSLLLTLSCIFVSCGTVAQVESKAYDTLLSGMLSHNVPEISVSQIRSTDSILFLDAREEREYEVSHIKNAKLVGYDKFSMKEVADLSKNTKIIVYCSVGYRSEKIAEQLIEAGFTDVSNLYGGIFEWKNQSKPTYSAKGETDEVHAYDKAWGIWLTKGKKVYK